ncbi:poly(3-hydroxyalkanoate) depolymerase [Nocardioides sp. BE266]|uniref:alpha/beta fold hydrolase n=1 Tax=Nocardioides sp. BE266 TaxID=2817725 RepID=UPI00285FD28E|nr:alpha/beta fold hydrolase [Nocardioides sp. BE266]MDR7252390.1 poly(3-hydroxyalkanoate) depolymerase [Nocardioides sp. BE266]
MSHGPGGPEHPRDLQVWGHRIRVSVRAGTGSGPPLLMCCGIGAGLDVLDPLVAELDPTLTVIRFDVPGVGDSPAPLLPYAFPQLATLVLRLVRRLGHDRVDVLGFSWGGALAQQLAFQAPRRVRRVVLLSTGTGALMVPGHPSALSRMLSPRRFRDPEYAASVSALLYGGTARTRADDVLELFRGSHLGGSRRGYVYQLLAGSVWTSLPFLPLVRQPVLVMTGDDDPIIPEVNGHVIARLLPRGRLHVFRGGHVEGVLRPEVLGPLVSDFLLARD